MNGAPRAISDRTLEVSVSNALAEALIAQGAWSRARELLERSYAVKCPSITQHLAGTKKAQRVLAAPIGNMHATNE